MNLSYQHLFTKEILQFAQSMARSSQLDILEITDDFIHTMVFDSDPLLCSIYLEGRIVTQLHCTCEHYRPKQPCIHLATTLYQLNRMSEEEVALKIEEYRSKQELLEDAFEEAFDEDEMDDVNFTSEISDELFGLLQSCDEYTLFRFLGEEFAMDDRLLNRFLEVVMEHQPEELIHYFIGKLENFCHALFEPDQLDNHQRLEDLSFRIEDLFEQVQDMYMEGDNSIANEFVIQTLKILDEYGQYKLHPIYSIMLDRTYLFVKELVVVGAMEKKDIDVVEKAMVEKFKDANLKDLWTEWFLRVK